MEDFYEEIEIFKGEEDCFGKYYDKSIKECQMCEEKKECERLTAESVKKIRTEREAKKEIEKLKKEMAAGNLYKVNSSSWVCYEMLKEGGTYEELTNGIEKRLVDLNIFSKYPKGRMLDIIHACKKGWLCPGHVLEVRGNFYKIRRKEDIKDAKGEIYASNKDLFEKSSSPKESKDSKTKGEENA